MERQRISVHICTRDRATEVSLLLDSLRYQTYQDFDIVLADGSQPQSIYTIHFVQSIINRLRLEGHRIHVVGVAIPGVCHARQTCIDKDPWPENPLILRIDDDTVLAPDYIEKLMSGIQKGYDLVSGLTPHCASPEVMRETRFVRPIINRIVLNDAGEIVSLGDDQAFTYDTEELIPTHHFRSSALYKRELHSVDGIDYKLGLSNVGFREELFMSIKAILAGRKLAVHTGAKYFHLQTPSGGCRFPDYAVLVGLDEQRMKQWLKRKYADQGNFLAVYDAKVGGSL